jgi:hypothetical protein
MHTEEEYDFATYSLRWSYSKVRDMISKCHNIVEGLKVEKEYSMKYVLALSYSKAITTLEEIITLLYYGYPDGALALSRSLYENYVLMLFLHVYNKDDNQLVQKYMDSYYLENNRLNRSYYLSILESINEVGVKNDNVNALTKDIGEQVEKADGLLSTFEKKYPNDKNRSGIRRLYWWAEDILPNNANFAEVQKALSKSKHLPKVFTAHYEHACTKVHCSFLGISNSLGILSEDIYFSHMFEGYELPLGFSLLIFKGHIKIFSQYYSEISYIGILNDIDFLLKDYMPYICGIS